MEHPFRTTMFGGFNRQDVTAYLESAAVKAASELTEEKNRADALARELEELKAEQEKTREELKLLNHDREELRRTESRASGELARIGGENEKLKAELAACREELAQAAARLEKLEPDAAAYAAVKERTAGVELEAHRRAQGVESRAKIMAGDLQRQMEQWMGKVEQQYAALRGEMDSCNARAAEQLSRAGECLNRVGVLMQEQERALKTVAKNYSAAIQNKKGE